MKVVIENDQIIISPDWETWDDLQVEADERNRTLEEYIEDLIYIGRGI